ncbi:MAG: class I SAM-dependent methyltransferase, partial [Verrucomicrobiaceae bacterium]|nr:class I SAM-dependent methyltransferase [Verrucomicrobiaceae bacterium]
MTPQELKAAYDRGENIAALLRQREGTGRNSQDIIHMSYDLQSGRYVSHQDIPELRKILDIYCQSLADEISALGPQHSLLEAGVGESTSLLYILRMMKYQPPVIHGIDLAWSRIRIGSRWFFERGGPAHTKFAAGSMADMPYMDNSFDVVFTSHAVEPNGGREKQLLSELYRITSKYLLLCEPAYEFASAEARARMDEHGYCKNLAGHARELGMNVVKHHVMLPCIKEDNPSAITLIAKNADAAPADPVYA